MHYNRSPGFPLGDYPFLELTKNTFLYYSISTTHIQLYLYARKSLRFCLFALFLKRNFNPIMVFLRLHLPIPTHTSMWVLWLIYHLDHGRIGGEVVVVVVVGVDLLHHCC